MTDQSLAHSPDVEQGVLATWLIDSEFSKAWRPDPELFASTAETLPLPLVAKHCSALWDGQTAISLPELLGHMRAAGNDNPTLAENLTRLVSCPAMGDVWAGISKLKELAALRKLRIDANSTVAKITSAAKLSDIQTELSAALVRSSERRGSSVVTASAAFRADLNHVNSKESVEYCTSGFQAIDERTGGIRPGYVWLIGADSHWGKSTLLAMMADINLKWGKRVLIVTAEDKIGDYTQRLTCRRANVRPNRVRDRQCTNTELLAYNTAGFELAKESVFFINGVGKKPSSIASDIRTAIHAHGIDLTFFDYMQALEGEDEKGGDRRHDLRKAGRELTAAVKQTNTAGVFFSQITRDKKELHKKPTKRDIRDCGDLANAAEVVALGFIPENDGPRQLYLDKAKGGRGNLTIEVEWNPVSGSFLHTAKGQLGLGLYDEEEEAENVDQRF